MNITHDRLERLVTQIFSAAGCQPDEAERISKRLVHSNLVGHDSHGVIRVSYYIRWLQEDKVRANRELEVVFDSGVFAT